MTWWIVGFILLLVFMLFSFGLDLWTDALWYQSVGFDAVFWTRLGAQVGLFAAALLGSLAILLLNVYLAGRLMPPPDPEPYRRFVPDPDGSHQRGGSGGRSGPRPGHAPGCRRAAPRHVRHRRHPRPDADRRRGARGPRRAHRPGDRRLGRERLGHRAAVGQSRAVLPGCGGRHHGSGLRAGYRLLPLRAPVPAARPGALQRHRAGHAGAGLRPVPRRGLAREPRVHDAGPGPPRDPRRAVPAVGGVRLPARQVRARVQQSRRPLHRRELHGPERPVPRV